MNFLLSASYSSMKSTRYCTPSSWTRTEGIVEPVPCNLQRGFWCPPQAAPALQFTLFIGAFRFGHCQVAKVLASPNGPASGVHSDKCASRSASPHQSGTLELVIVTKLSATSGSCPSSQRSRYTVQGWTLGRWASLLASL